LVIGAVVGLALGILVSVTTDVPFAPEIGLVLGGLLGWLSHRSTARADRWRRLSNAAGVPRGTAQATPGARIACHRLTPAALRQFTVASVSETLLVVEDAKLGGEGGYPQGLSSV